MNKTIIINGNIRNAIQALKETKADLPIGCNIFVICSTEYDPKGNVVFDFFDIIKTGIELGFDYINTIVYPTLSKQSVAFIDNVRYVVWLCIDRSKLIFNKDKIREKHIWKDVEWGKREKNYNPKGKDPGNVWIPTLDNGAAIITKHILLSDDEVIQKLISMTESKNDVEFLINPTDSINNYYKSDFSVNSNENNLFSRVIFGSSESMREVKNNSVTVAVTSPPYWNLKNYFKEGQIGQESYSVYLQRMKTVWENCYRKLKTNGSLWININIRVQQGKVILIPKDIIKICQEIGYFYKGIIIWHKSSGIPTSEKNIVDRHEYVLLFTKEENFTVNYDKFSSFCDYKNEKINGGAFWNINRKAGSVGKKYIHPAIYPNDLVSRILLIASNELDIVIDPFLGSGTSLIASLQLNRSFIGFEYNEAFKDLITSRCIKELDDMSIILFDSR